MTQTEKLFLQAMKAALNNGQVDWEQDISREEWAALLSLAETHRVLPMVFQAVYDCPAARRLEPEFFTPYRARVRRLVMLQTRKTVGFLPLLEQLRQVGAEPLVVKGLVCRGLYPNPDCRMSSDEDILIPPDKFPICHEVMTRWGMTTTDPEGAAYESPYTQPGGVLYIEVHKSLFPPESQAYGDLNRFFLDARSRAVEQDGVPTLAPTDHMLYLILHAFKHFLHSGFGIRQVCDIVLCANAWGPRIDWAALLESCRVIRAEQFAAGLFRIGWKYLNFSLEASCYPLQWQSIYVDEEPLLEDILRSGIYGSSDMSRKHSSTMTLKAVEAQKAGAAPAGGVLKSIFPPARDLERRYTYLQGKPYLLPIAWAERLVRYTRETRRTSCAPGDSIRIGNERVSLLRRYGIIDKK